MEVGHLLRVIDELFVQAPAAFAVGDAESLVFLLLPSPDRENRHTTIRDEIQRPLFPLGRIRLNQLRAQLLVSDSREHIAGH